MFATLSSFLPPVLHPGSQDKDKPPLKPTTEDVSAPQPVMAADDQGALRKKKERTHESFIVVRPPPSKSNHPLNLQVQLVPPTSRPPAGTRQSIDSTDTSLSRTTSNRSDVSGYSSVTSFSTVSSTSTSSGGGRRMIIPLYNLQAHNVMTNVIVDAGTDAKIAKFMKRGLEVIGLVVLEPVELCGISYEDSLGPGSYPQYLSPDDPHTPTSSHLSLTSENTQESSPPMPSSPAPTQERAPTGARKLFGKMFKKKDSPMPSSPTTPRSPVPPLESTPRAPGKRSSLLLNPPMSATSHAFPDPQSSAAHNTILGIQPSVRSPSPNQGFATQKLRPTCYSWPVQKWLKGPPEGLATPVERLLEVRLDWTRAPPSKRDGKRGLSRAKRDSIIHSNTPSTSSLPRKQTSVSSHRQTPGSPRRSVDRSASPARESLHSTTTATTEDGSPAPRRARDSHDDDEDDDSDPEDSETPWTCHLVVRRLHPHTRHSSGHAEDAAANTPEVRVRVAAVVPAPHHPKVVSLLKIPFPLPDLILSTQWTPHGTQAVEIEARKRVVTPSGVARPAAEMTPSGTPTQAGIAGGVGKIAASAGNFFSSSGKTIRPGTSSGGHGSAGRMHHNGGGGGGGGGGEQIAMSGMLLSAEEIKDVVCCTGLWLVVREGFGGVGKVKRQGDGWRIRG